MNDRTNLDNFFNANAVKNNDRFVQKPIMFDFKNYDEFNKTVLQNLEASITLLTTPSLEQRRPLEMVFSLTLMPTYYVGIRLVSLKQLGKKSRTDLIHQSALSMGITSQRIIPPYLGYHYLCWCALTLTMVACGQSDYQPFTYDGVDNQQCVAWITNLFDEGWKVERLVLLPSRSRLDSL